MKGRARWFLTVVSPVVLSAVLLSPEWTYAYVYGRVGPGPSYPADGTITYIAYLKKGGETDNEILTEDGYNCDQGQDQGYQSEYFWVEWGNFTSPTAGDKDTLVVLFTGIGTELGNAGSIMDTIDTDVGYQDFGNSSWGASSNPDVPTGLTATPVTPGVVNLSWNTTKTILTYRLYRSSQGSGGGNYASNGRYARIAKDLPGPSYQDDTAPTDTCWYILVADDGTNFSGHTDEVQVDAALPVQLATFTATGADKKVILEWTTQSEWDNRGFHIYRRRDGSRDFERITQELIAGAGNSSDLREYSWEDRRVEVGQTYWYKLETVDFQGGTRTYGPVSATPMDALPITYRLDQNYPNPFNPETWISYQVPQDRPVIIKIYNIRGQLVSTLVDEEKAPGHYRARWNGQDLHGDPVASGVYFCQMRSGSFTETVKMILLK